MTNLAALSATANVDQSRVVSLNLEGTVWWSSEVEGRLILHDDTGTLQLEMDLPGQMPRLGDRLRLKGLGSVVKARDVIKLAAVPVVDHDGLHSMVGKSGTVHLKAGRHPIRVAWFNRTDQYGLNVDYEGPNLPRQKIPDSILSHAQVDAATGATNFVKGLDYRCCEGQWWSLLPNFDHMTAVKTGVVDNFDIGVRSRISQVGMLFAGFIELPTDGNYTFSVSSDDGSRLFIGESSLHVRTVGHASLPSPRLMSMQEAPVNEPEYEWSEIEGAVTSVHRPQGTLELELMTDLGLVRMKVAEDADNSYTLRPHNRIHVAGVSRKIRNLDGRWMRGEFFVQRWQDIDQSYISPAIWNEYPAEHIASLLKTPSNVVHSIVHLRGKVASQGTDQGFVLDDGSGQIVLSGKEAGEYVDREIDVLGRLSINGNNLVLDAALFHSFGKGGATTDKLPLLTTIEQIYQLSLEESARKYPVKVRGVITSPMEGDGAVLQDSSRGIYVVLGGPIPLHIGDYCEIEGVTGPYQFSQFIQASRVEVLGAGSLPEPVRPTWDQLINGSLHCNYVELEGVVASIDGDTITLLTRGGRINVRLNATGPAMPRNSVGATVRLRGCLLADWEGDTHRVAVGSIYLDQHWVTVVHPAPIDPFSVPSKRVGDLLQFDPQAGALQRIKVSGQLVFKDKEVCYLMDAGNGLRFIPLDPVNAQVGDLVDVVGFLELGGPSSVLREAIVRRTGQVNLPPPRKLDSDNLLRDEYDSTLVQIDGVLLSSKETPEGHVLDLQSGVRRFVAAVKSGAEFDSELKPGSRLQLVGVYVGQGGNRVLGRPIDSFRLLINSGSDITVLSRPPWWTLRRMLAVVGILAAILAAALVWIKMLQRTVEERTQQLGDQIRERQRAERQRELEQERARLAHDLHDDLGARLTEVNMLASLVKSPATSAEEKKKYADELNDIALRMVTSLDEIVWAVNPRNDTVSSLAGYFGAYAQRLLELASVNCGLDVAEELPERSLDPKFRQEVFLAFKEALTNVIQHAGASKVWLRIFVENNDLVVIVSDDGCGILSDERKVGADGLANMRERMSALGGSCSIDSDPKTGTSVRLQAPIQEVLI